MRHVHLSWIILGMMLFTLSSTTLSSQEMDIKSKWEIRYGSEVVVHCA